MKIFSEYTTKAGNVDGWQYYYSLVVLKRTQDKYKNFELDVDHMSGGVLWIQSDDSTTLGITPFWEGDKRGLSNIEVVDPDTGRSEIFKFGGKLNPTGDRSKDEQEYLHLAHQAIDLFYSGRLKKAK